MEMERECLFAGQWYPASRNQQKKYFFVRNSLWTARAVIVPHAGWIYSGRVAGMTFGAIKPADIFILIGPNHTGAGEAVAVFPGGKWLLAEDTYLSVAEEISRQIIKNSRYARPDVLAHLREHSLEVQMPFIQMLNPEAKIVPITLADYRPAVISDLAGAIALAINHAGGGTDKRVVLVASTDLSHYLPQETAKKLDRLAIAAIQKMDAAGLLKTVAENDISMCGAGPVAVVLEIVKTLYPGSKVELLKYATSAETSGDSSSVVGYAGLIVY
jgi:hypothetical protein